MDFRLTKIDRVAFFSTPRNYLNGLVNVHWDQNQEVFCLNWFGQKMTSEDVAVYSLHEPVVDQIASKIVCTAREVHHVGWFPQMPGSPSRIQSHLGSNRCLPKHWEKRKMTQYFSSSYRVPPREFFEVRGEGSVIQILSQKTIPAAAIGQGSRYLHRLLMNEGIHITGREHILYYPDSAERPVFISDKINLTHIQRIPFPTTGLIFPISRLGETL